MHPLYLLFSKNAKKLHLSIALGATQFENLYGKNNKTTKKITQAKSQFVQNFNRYAPAESFESMDLLDEKDTNFIREFSSRTIKNIQIGQIRYTVHCSNSGYALSDVTIWRIEKNNYLLFSGRFQDFADLKLLVELFSVNEVKIELKKLS